jgi:hypothetical protein
MQGLTSWPPARATAFSKFGNCRLSPENNVSHPYFQHPGKIGTLNQAWSFNWKDLQDAPGTVPI